MLAFKLKNRIEIIPFVYEIHYTDEQTCQTITVFVED